MGKLPLTVVIPTRNEQNNLARCLRALEDMDEIVVVDSQSTDDTVAIAESFGAKVVQFRYQGGWPKKRGWVLNTYQFRNDWILLLDSDEILLEPVKREIGEAIRTSTYDGYWLRFQIWFLGRQLRYGDTELWKLFLFRKGKGRYEERLRCQDMSMSDVEVHEHVVVDGKVGYLKSPVRHENVNCLSRYIQKHNEYSNWEAKVYLYGTSGIRPSLWGTQAQRRRWLKGTFMKLPGSPVLLFFYRYVLRMGFLDGVSGFIYCCFRAVQMFHIKAKIYEIQRGSGFK
jgi:glycosyltransferase involved in cell wall biosynthesis